MCKLRIVPILVVLTVLLSSCSLFVAKPLAEVDVIGKADGSIAGAEATTVTVQTGYPSGEIQQPQVRFRGNVYVYDGEGRDKPLPDGFAKVGIVEALNNDPLTFSGEFCGSRVEIGQEIFASSSHIDQIYLAYEMGYARFDLPSGYASVACPTVSQAEPSVTAIGYNALCVRVFPEFYSGIGVAPIVVVDSAEALADYTEVLGTVIDFGGPSAAELSAALALYQGEHNAFFETHFLLLAQIREPCDDIRHEPIEICVDDGDATLWVRRLVPEADPCDCIMVDRMLFAEVARDDLDPAAIESLQIAFETAEMIQTDSPGHTGCEG